MRKQKKKIRTKPRQKRRLRRFIRWAFVIFVGVLGLGLVLVWRFLPDEKVRSFVSEKLTARLGRPVMVEGISLSPFGKIEVRGLRVGFREEEGMKEGSLFRLKRLRVQFKLLPLLRRRLEVTGIQIDGPKLHIVPLLLEVVKSERAEEKAVPILKPLPLSLGLFRLNLKDFQFVATVPGSSGERELSLSGVNLEVSDLRLPRNYQETSKDLRGKIRLFTEGGEAILREKWGELKVVLDLNLEGEWKREKNWLVDVNFGIRPTASKSGKEIRLRLGMEGEGYGERVRIRRTDLSIGNQKAVEIEGKLENFGPEASFDIALGGRDLDLKKLAETLKNFLPEHLVKPFDEIDIDGSIRMVEGKAWGSLENVQFRYRSSLRNGEVEYSVEGLGVKQGDFVLEAGGTWTPRGLNNGKIIVNGNVESIHYEMNDTVSISAERLTLNMDSGLDSAFFPGQGFLVAQAGNVLGGSLNLGLNWFTGEGLGQGVENLVMKGEIRGDSLRLESFPNARSGTTGMMNLVGDLETKGLEDIQVHLVGLSPGIGYEYGKGVEKTPSLQLVSDMTWRVDSTFQEWTLDSASVRLNELFSGHLVGRFFQAEGKYLFTLQRGQVHADQIPEYLPAKLRDRTEGMLFWGEGELSANVAGKMMGDSTLVSVDGKLKLVGVGMEYPVQSFKAEEIEGEIRFGGVPEKLKGSGEVIVGRMVLGKMRSDPILGSRLSFDLPMISLDSLRVEGGKISVDPLAIRGNFFIGMGQITGSPRMVADIEVAFQSEDSVEVTDGMAMLGSLKCRFHGETLDPEKQWIRVTGEIDIDSLDVVKENLFRVRGIRGRLPFQIDADQIQRKFLPRANYRPYEWVEYERQRPVYRHLFPEEEIMRVEAIEVSGYRMNELLLDVKVGGGYVQVPWFNLKVLEGNVGGSFLLNLGSGAKQDLVYEIRAQASRINSADLANIKIGDEEETELNATLAFRGKGIDLAEGVDLDGYFHITKIGPKFASTLLEGMDPRGSDRSIRLTRRLLNTGWKPKLFSFELRHGYVYPSLALSQPWFSPVRIPGQLEYGRLPLEFFLKSRADSK